MQPVTYRQQKDAVKQHWGIFQELVAHAHDLVRIRRYAAGAVYAEIAAQYAMSHHAGVFASPQLEQILLTIGNAIDRAHTSGTQRPTPNEHPRHVLHVLTQAAGIGGDTRLLWRWIAQDGARSHSVVITRQGGKPVPQTLQDAVQAAHGTIHLLNQQPGNLLAWAQALHALAASVDLVVLHTHPYDVLPVLAFANKQHVPPVVFVDHADHVFWIGASISDVVVNLREAGALLAQQRRGIEPARCALLPTSLGPITRTLTRSQAKQQLGLSQDSVLLLSIARPHKYHALAGEPSFADALLPVINKHEQAVALVIGPDHGGEWVAAEQQTQGRIKALGKHEDTAVFYQAADIYIDSFPIVSITSLLEAGSYGVPVVSRCPTLESVSVLCADAPGLAGTLLRGHDLGEYQSSLCRLIEDVNLRIQFGEQTQQDIAAFHSGAHWGHYLHNLYRHAATVSQRSSNEYAVDQPYIGEVDVLLPYLFQGEPSLDEIEQFHLRLLPLPLRLQRWMQMVGQKRTFLPGLLLPEWMGTRLERARLLHT